MTDNQFKTLIDDLIGHAYNSGYYSGQKLDLQKDPLHTQAVQARNDSKRLVLAAFAKVRNDK